MRERMIKLGDMIRQRRELLGLLQPQLASISGVSIRTIQLIEQGKGNPSLDTLLRLTETIGYELALILKEPGKSYDK